MGACLAQLVEHMAVDLWVVSLNPILDAEITLKKKTLKKRITMTKQITIF